MVESLDIQDLLNAGYFTPSRSRSPRSFVRPLYQTGRDKLMLDSHNGSSSRPQTPPYSQAAPAQSYARPRPPRSRTSYPPPPTVEDEATSLSREHGVSLSALQSEAEPPARGEIDQYPLIIEVNPERRFVMLTEPSEDPDKERDGAQKTSDPRLAHQRKSPNRGPYDADTARRQDAGTGASDGPALDGHKPPMERRRSRQDLPPLETNLMPDKPSHHQRSRSAITGGRPDYFADRQSRNLGDNLLSPEVVKHGSSRREKVYYEYGQPKSASARSSMQRSHSHLAEDRESEEKRSRAPLDPAANKRSNSNIESGKSRRFSNERMRDDRYRDGYTTSRSSTNDRSPAYGRSDRDYSKRSSTYSSRDSRAYREDSRSSDEYSKSSRPPGRSRRKSVVHQEDRDSLLSPSKRDAPRTGRSRSRGPSLSIPMADMPDFPDDKPANPRASFTFPLSMSQGPSAERSRTQLPYPDDDRVVAGDPLDSRVTGDRLKYPRLDTSPTASMPEFPLPASGGPEFHHEAKARVPPEIPVPDSWKPLAFEPEKDGVRPKDTVGAFRRYSESVDGNTVPIIPECQRKRPVAGRLDWLTLPRTAFNICPDCYSAVFANSPYGSHFVPLLYPADRPIACDFGSSTWYRIAWLLTCRNNKPDLRLFHQVANVMAISRDQPCPGNRKAVRNWLTIRNPCTRRPVFNFTVCYQCARTIEALLPNLMGVFVPLDPRSEPMRGMCSMHFIEKRKRFVMYFDILETTSERAFYAKEAPNIQYLAEDLERLSMVSECFEDRPVSDGYWHIMQYLPELTVCGECFNEVVQPRLKDEGVIARNFYMKPQKIPVATCQLYSRRMRDIFNKACRYNDPRYLEGKVRERLEIERDIHAKLASLTQRDQDDEAWIDEQVDKLVQEWKKWE